MAGTSDKARFHLEQFVPELRELERKEVFSKQEVASIVRRRSDFEHTINARGSHVSDYVRYVQYEMNLESLRRQRVRRLGVKTLQHTGSRRIFSILDRAVQRFPADIGLWMLYINHARKQNARKKTKELLTRLVRLHPTKPEVWRYAANYIVEDVGDMVEARSFFQRGLRFCEQDEQLWLDYANLELSFIAKIFGRRRALGIDGTNHSSEAQRLEMDELASDLMTLPADIDGGNEDTRGLKNVDEGVLNKISHSPLLAGAVPIAVFDAAAKKVRDVPNLAFRFYDLVAAFDNLPCREAIAKHVLETLRMGFPKSVGTLMRDSRQPLMGMNGNDPAYPAAFRIFLQRVEESSRSLDDICLRRDLYYQSILFVLGLMDDTSLGTELTKVLELTVAKLWKHFQTDVASEPRNMHGSVEAILDDFGRHNLISLAETGRSWSNEVWH